MVCPYCADMLITFGFNMKPIYTIIAEQKYFFMDNKQTDFEILKQYLDYKGLSYSWMSETLGKNRLWVTRNLERNRATIPPELKEKITLALNIDIFSGENNYLLIRKAREKEAALKTKFENFLSDLDKKITQFEKIQMGSPPDKAATITQENNIPNISINQ